MHLSVRLAHRSVCVDLQCAVDHSKLADERYEFHLLIDGDAAAGMALRIVPAEPGALQGTNGGETARREFFALGKLREPGENLVTFAKNQSIVLLAARSFVNQAGLHSLGTLSRRDRARLREASQRRDLVHLSQTETARREKATSGQA